jgi:hypothetical protein
MKAPSLYREIKNAMGIIARAVISEEDDFIDRRWREIRQEINSLARQSEGRIEDGRCGFRVCMDPKFIECRNCGEPCPAGSKRCPSCPQRFKRRRS